VHYITFSRPILRTVADKNLTAAWAIAFLALRPQIQLFRIKELKAMARSYPILQLLNSRNSCLPARCHGILRC
jgi:hypothetical protein